MGNIFNSVYSSYILRIHNAATHYEILYDSNSSKEEKKISKLYTKNIQIFSIWVSNIMITIIHVKKLFIINRALNH